MTMRLASEYAPLHHASYERDACGVGLVVDIAGNRSRSIVERALAGVVNLTHRGGVGADARTGDGAGILTQVPTKLFSPFLAERGFGDLGDGAFAVAMVFLPRNGAAADGARGFLEDGCTARGLTIAGWRDVPTDESVLGDVARSTLPGIAQLLVIKPEGMDGEAFEVELFLARRAAERAAMSAGMGESDFFVSSFSARTIVYKGFCLPQDLAAFYLDLLDPAYESAIALFHQRYSTNTLPTWAMAQPFRYIAHNGEINTVAGNRQWMQARAPQLNLFGHAQDELEPVVSLAGSDSLSLDNVVELLDRGGRSLPHAMMMLVPEPWEQLPLMDPARRAFYDFHAGLIEPWDGPAALSFTDGVIAGATLDRNGLRPMRWAITSDGLFIAGSEAGTVKVDERLVIEKGRLGPGQMILVDTARGVVLRNPELKSEVANAAPYREWLDKGRVALTVAGDVAALPAAEGAAGRKSGDAATVAVQRALGYSAEDLRLVVHPMAVESKEPTWSMGDDAPLAVLSEKPRPLHVYFRQRFAQVTNPPIDSLRERSVMALDTYLGPRGNLLVGEQQQARLLHLPSVAISTQHLDAILGLQGSFRAARVSTLFPLPSEEAAAQVELEKRLDGIIAEAEAAIDGGASIVVLSDRDLDGSTLAVPMLLAVGTLHHHLIRSGKRMMIDVVADCGEVADVHVLACLVGYGASAVCPWMALNAASEYAGTRGCEGLSDADLRRNYLAQLDKGFLKVSSKMGISTATGYRGAQIFETIGLSPVVVERSFTGTPARLGGVGMAEIAADTFRRHREAFAENAAKLPDLGFVRYRKDGEPHGYEPPMVKALQAAVNTEDRSLYAEYREHVKSRPLTAVRDLMTISPLGPVAPLEEVEPVSAIIERFIITAMSLGALSPEAYRTLAVGMNRLGARSNSGEGGEDPAWYDEPGPDVHHSRVKQVASGRFGVSARYLSMAEEIEIKMAQGAKPGEGGQLPGHKVTPFVARIRHAVAGLPLISPPPHHDIYSIEDLAQLIYDLRQINPKAKIGVKLVAEAGVGTIAAGVAKAKADYVLISGHDGGTGAAPLTSIKYAGAPWELGLAETQQTLVMNGLRSRVRLRTDGGIKTAEDVAIAAMLGAEEFGFGTSVLIAIGCDMARQCHLNSCPTGIATQREDLRAKFAGKPEQVVNYFIYLAESMRELLASLGARSIGELVGRSDLLGQKELPGRAGKLDLSGLFATPAAEAQRKKSMERPQDPSTLDDTMLPQVISAIEHGKKVALRAEIRTADRTVGAKVANAITTRRLFDLAPGSVTLSYTGSAGQSFGAFTVNGMRLVLEGEANDYVGKGMSGGEITIKPSADAAFTDAQVIAGNTLLYGATGGRVHLAGKAGERFAVRNSGVKAVVEGLGDHGCEYMTGGIVVVLGPTGRNFGAGMTNGIAYVYDPKGGFPDRINGESVLLEQVQANAEDAELIDLLRRHVAETGSKNAERILANWNTERANFWQVIPRAAIAAKVEEREEEPASQGVAD